MKTRQTQPTDLTPFVHRIGDQLSRINFPDDRQWDEPKYPAGFDPARQNGIEPDELECGVVPTKKEMAYGIAFCCVVLLVCLLVFAVTR